MVDAIPEVVPTESTLSEGRAAFLELCSMKRMRLTIKEKLVQLLPTAIEFVKSYMSVTPLLEEASAVAGDGDTTRGAQVIIRTVTALKSGTFSSRDVSQPVLVALRDQLCVHEGALTAPSSQSVAPPSRRPA